MKMLAAETLPIISAISKGSPEHHEAGNVPSFQINRIFPSCSIISLLNRERGCKALLLCVALEGQETILKLFTFKIKN